MHLNEIVATDVAPIHCAACYAQQPGLRHVDFDAAADRGYAGEGEHKIPVDDIIVCENCVKRAGELVGMVDAEQRALKIIELETKLVSEKKAHAQSKQYAERLELAFESRPAPITIDHRCKPRKVASGS